MAVYTEKISLGGDRSILSAEAFLAQKAYKIMSYLLIVH